MDSDLCETSAVELRRLIGARQISPLELLETCIAPIEQVNPAVNVVCATDFTRAREAARTAEPQVMRGDALSVISVLGPKDRTVADTAMLFAASVGMVTRDPLSYPVDASSFWSLANDARSRHPSKDVKPRNKQWPPM